MKYLPANSLSLLYLVMIIPTKMFMIKKLPITMISTKNNAAKTDSISADGTRSIPYIFDVRYIMSLHYTELDIMNSVDIA